MLCKHVQLLESTGPNYPALVLLLARCARVLLARGMYSPSEMGSQGTREPTYSVDCRLAAKEHRQMLRTFLHSFFLSKEDILVKLSDESDEWSLLAEQHHIALDWIFDNHFFLWLYYDLADVMTCDLPVRTIFLTCTKNGILMGIKLFDTQFYAHRGFVFHLLHRQRCIAHKDITSPKIRPIWIRP